MSDVISRQEAIDAFDGVKVDEENCTEYDIGYNDGIDFAISKLSVLPPARPTQLTDDDIETIRIHLSAFKENLCNQHRWNEAKEYEALIDRLTAQPEPLKIDLSGYSEEDWERLKKEWGNTPITVLSAQPKRGKWILGDMCSVKGYWATCSVCGHTSFGGGNFCRECGAKMGGNAE